MRNNDKMIGYIGTYTKGESEGIYSFTLDTSSPAITDVKLAGKVENPTYLALTDDNHYLYSVAKEGESGGVAAFSINKETGGLTFINNQMSEGSPPCYVSVDSQKRILFSANYHKGTAEAYPLSANDGAIQPVSSVAKHEGSGPDERQDKAHTHYAAFTPDEKVVVVCELGIDQLITYKEADGVLEEVGRLSVKPGSGPRHLVFHPNKTIAYVLTEFGSDVITLKYNEKDGSFEAVDYHSTIPEDFSENNQCSAIHISSDGRFLYAGNRGHDSIAVFQVDESTGQLQLVERTSTEGNWPRDFALDPTEVFLVASNQNSSNLVLFARDKVTGKLTLVQSDITVPDPVCVKFLNI